MNTFSRILVPVDFSESSQLAIDHAAMMAERFAASVDLLHVWEPLPYAPPDLVVSVPGQPNQTFAEFARSQAGVQMAHFLGALKVRHVSALGRLETGDPARVIVEVAEAEGYDLIVMGTHGHTRLAHVLLGSVAERVVRRAPCAVLTIRGHKGEKARTHADDIATPSTPSTEIAAGHGGLTDRHL